MDQSDFDLLAADNLCGQTLLKIVSRGNSIIAELMRLSYHIPKVFVNPKDPRQAKYLQVLFDFKYLRAPDGYENRIAASDDLIDIDDEFQETHLKILTRFYDLFANIYKYARDFKEFLKNLQAGTIFIAHTVEDVLLNRDGKQLVSEALYLGGVMLLMLDRLLPGPTRERLIVCYLRKRGESMLQHFDEVTKLCRDTGFRRNSPHPKNYPEDYFARLEMPDDIVALAIDRLRSDDIYNLVRIYPSPNHRSTALSTQAGMIYVILYFAPSYLHRQRGPMREIVDKHFNDNWIITLYMGWTVNIREEWARYKAANAALANTLEIESVRELVQRHSRELGACEQLLRKFLTEGQLEDKFVLANINSLLKCLRRCNVTVRWLMLHFRATLKPLVDTIRTANISTIRVIQCLLHTAQLEFLLKEIFKTLLDSKEERWEECRNEASSMMQELAVYFSGTAALSRVEKNEELQKWFLGLKKQIDGLEYGDSKSSKTGRTISKVIEALEDVEQFEQVNTGLQIKQYLATARDFLSKMVQAVNIKDDILAIVDKISDFSYAWEIIHDFKSVLHKLVRENNFSVKLFRATFLKLASILETPLVRISQADSKDVVSVARYYSAELVDFVQQVLEVIPKNVFAILNQLIDLQTKKMRQLPVQLELAQVANFAQMDQRYVLARSTHKISVFTEGVLAMEQTLLGVIEVDPRKVLSTGIRKELVQRIAARFHRALIFTVDKRGNYDTTDVESRLKALSWELSSFRRSFEYIQDYIRIYGLKMWQEESARIMAYNTEQECNRYTRKKILDSQSTYQSRTIPIPTFDRADREGKYPNFVGRTAAALLGLTDARKFVYAPACTGWYTVEGKEVCGISLFSRLRAAIGVEGLVGVDKVLSFRIVRDLTRLVSNFEMWAMGKLPSAGDSGSSKAKAKSSNRRNARRKNVGAIRNVLKQCNDKLMPLHAVPLGAKKVHDTLVSHLKRPYFESTLAWILRIGQAQLVRKSLRNELNFSCKLDSNLLHSALDAFNGALLNDIRAHYQDRTKPYPGGGNPVLSDLTKLLEATGINEPLTKIYLTCEKLTHLPLYLFAFLMRYLPKMTYDEQFGSLIRASYRDELDGAALVVGIVTVLKQLHPSYTEQLLALLGQFVRSEVHTAFSGSSKPMSLPKNVLTVLSFLELFCQFSHCPRSTLEGHIPDYILNSLQT